eukprot:5816816-Amphidinium_carterae.1
MQPNREARKKLEENGMMALSLSLSTMLSLADAPLGMYGEAPPALPRTESSEGSASSSHHQSQLTSKRIACWEGCPNKKTIKCCC